MRGECSQPGQEYDDLDDVVEELLGDDFNGDEEEDEDEPEYEQDDTLDE